MSDLAHAAVLLFDGFESLDAFGPYEVLAVGTGVDAAPDYEVSLVTADPTDSVTSAHGATVVPDGTVADVDPDLLVVPGGGWNDDASSGARDVGLDVAAAVEETIEHERHADVHVAD